MPAANTASGFSPLARQQQAAARAAQKDRDRDHADERQIGERRLTEQQRADHRDVGENRDRRPAASSGM